MMPLHMRYDEALEILKAKPSTWAELAEAMRLSRGGTFKILRELKALGRITVLEWAKAGPTLTPRYRAGGRVDAPRPERKSAAARQADSRARREDPLAEAMKKRIARIKPHRKDPLLRAFYGSGPGDVLAQKP